MENLYIRLSLMPPLKRQPELKIIDITGKTVYSRILENISSSVIDETIELSEVANGLYWWYWRWLVK